MSKKIPVTLTKSDKTQLEEKPPVSLGNGYCEFPFEYKGKSYNSCVKKGDDHICATSLTKSGKLKTYAICKTKKKLKHHLLNQLLHLQLPILNFQKKK